MHRLALACIGLVACATMTQAQTLSVPSIVVAPGGSVVATVSGTPGQNFALIASITNGGFSYAGTALSVGTDVAVLAIGVLDGAGSATVSVTPPFPARDRYYIQAATSASAGFSPLSASNAIVLLNAQEARVYMAVGGGVNANGSSFAVSPGVTVQRTGVGVYQISFAAFVGQFGGPNVIPNITPFTPTTGISGISANNAGFTVAFPADTGFFFTATPVRR